jgi:RNA polymerase sigma factor (sigma-70 family)
MDDIRVLLPKLRRLLHSRGRTTDETDDLIQEAFLRLHQYRHNHVVEQPEAFLVRTALNLSVDLRRQRRVANIAPHALEVLPLVDPTPPPDVALAGQERLHRFRKGLLAISPRQREVFILHRIEGCSFPQIAQRLEISVSMAEKHAARAMIFLADWMREEPVDAGMSASHRNG